MFEGDHDKEEVHPDFLSGQRSKPAEVLEPGTRTYPLSSSGWGGFIVAGIVQFVEDDGELFGPSGARIRAPSQSMGAWVEGAGAIIIYKRQYRDVTHWSKITG